MNALERYFAANTKNLIHKWQHYFEVYDRHFARFRGSAVNVLEIGVGQGGSLQMWKDYFGPRANIFGVDINPNCAALAEERIRIFVGDQEDAGFLAATADAIGRIDILIDDGGHTMGQQIKTFEALFARVDAHGVYLIEDLHTSYWADWGGGYRKPGTFVEYSKQFIDWINAWHSTDGEQLAVSDFTRSAHSLHFYDSVLAVEKRPIEPPHHRQTGTPMIHTPQAPRQFPSTG